MKKIILNIGLLFLVIAFFHKGLPAQAEIEENMEAVELSERQFNITGFLTFQYQQINMKSQDNTLQDMMNDDGHFSLNNFNLYLLFNVNDDLLAFGEVRLCFIPTGKEQLTPIDSGGNIYLGEDGSLINQILVTPFDNSSIDNQNNILKYGSIHIERAYIEWNKYSLANIRFGRYLTPFGIWSQDHGDPAIKGVRIPLLVSAPYPSLGMPQWQTGVELIGKVNIPGIDLFIDYATYIGNGVSDSDSILDEEDGNKAFGGFLNFKLPLIVRIFDVEFGCSGYYGERTMLFNKTLTPSALILASDPTTYAGSFNYNPSVNQYYNKQMDKIALAHIKITIRPLPFSGTFVLQAEGMRHWIDEDGLMTELNANLTRQWQTGAGTRLVDMAGQPRDPEDYIFNTYYIQAEYQFFGRVTPYFKYEWFKVGMSKEPQIRIRLNKLDLFSMGLNIKPYHRLIIKAEWAKMFARVPGTWIEINPVTRQVAGMPFQINNDIDVYQASVTLSF